MATTKFRPSGAGHAQRQYSAVLPFILQPAVTGNTAPGVGTHQVPGTPQERKIGKSAILIAGEWPLSSVEGSSPAGEWTPIPKLVWSDRPGSTLDRVVTRFSSSTSWTLVIRTPNNSWEGPLGRPG